MRQVLHRTAHMPNHIISAFADFKCKQREMHQENQSLMRVEFLKCRLYGKKLITAFAQTNETDSKRSFDQTNHLLSRVIICF